MAGSRDCGCPILPRDYFQNGNSSDEEQNIYICPNGEVLRYATTNRDGYRNISPIPKKVLPAHSWRNGLDQKIIRKWSLNMSGKTTKKKCGFIGFLLRVKNFINVEKKRSNEASQIQTNCMGFVICQLRGY